MRVSWLGRAWRNRPGAVSRELRRASAAQAARLRAEFVSPPASDRVRTPVKAWTDQAGAYHERFRMLGGTGRTRSADTIESVWPAGQVPADARTRRPAGHHRSGRTSR
jgi:hypothetical protein